MTDRVRCHCGWVRPLVGQPPGSSAGSNLLERHQQEVHGLGTPDFYRPAPGQELAAFGRLRQVADPNPFPPLRIL